MLHDIDNQELNTILAALRFYQEKGQGSPSLRSDAIHDIATNRDQNISMDDDGIDALCEKLNTDQSFVDADGNKNTFNQCVAGPNFSLMDVSRIADDEDFNLTIEQETEVWNAVYSEIKHSWDVAYCNDLICDKIYELFGDDTPAPTPPVPQFGVPNTRGLSGWRSGSDYNID